MELSTITTETKNILSQETTTTTAAAAAAAAVVAAATMAETTTNNNNSQLFSNDNNLQSQTQKSPIMTNNSSPVKMQIEDQIIISNNNSNCNNKNQSLIVPSTPTNNNCHELNNQTTNTTMTSATNTKLTQKNDKRDDKDATSDNLDATLLEDVKLTVETLLVQVEAELDIVETATSSQTSIICASDGSCTKTAEIKPVSEDEIEKSTKDIVTLRNLEITPPPQPEGSIETPEPPVFKSKPKSGGTKRKSARFSSETPDPSDESANSRSKRQRTQTKLFQVEVKEAAKVKPRSVQKEKSSSSRRSSAVSAKKTPARVQPVQQPPRQQQTQISQDFQDVIFYEKNDHLAIRNEENTFYLCQLTEHVRVPRPFVKVKWLDTNDNGETYFATSHYDKVPQKSIIMPVTLRKLKNDRKGPQTYALEDDIRDSVLDRLKRSLNVPSAETE